MQTFYQRRKGSFFCSMPTNLTYPAHLHKQLELIYVISGTIVVTINGEAKELLKGCMSLSFPNTIHSLSTPSNSQIILLIFDPYLADFYTINLAGKKPLNPFLMDTDIHKDIPFCMNALFHIKKNCEAPIETSLIKGFLTIILCRLLENLTLTNTCSHDLNLTQQVLVHIDEHFTEPLTLEQVAEQLNTSKYYLSRIFHQQLDTSFSYYVNNQRIQLAQYLLLESTLSITDISFQSGFESMRTFYRTFKEICHITPTKYRELNRQK